MGYIDVLFFFQLSIRSYRPYKYMNIHLNVKTIKKNKRDFNYNHKKSLKKTMEKLY